MRRNRGFTLVEMVIATTIFAAGGLYIYATFTGVARSSKTATLDIDLGSQNKRALSRLFNELQATSLAGQDTDGLDSTDPEDVFLVEVDPEAPPPLSEARIVTRVAAVSEEDGDLLLGAGLEQARERVITASDRIRFRKVVGYRFNEGAGTIVPEWSDWITVAVNADRQLVRLVPGGRPTILSNRVDAFDVEVQVDGTIVVTLVSARRDPTGPGLRRYANAITIHPKN